ncbi:hypothetical protein SK128_027435 [Halocaridina rubra]|uniref:Uncharacterized protein n=1 Tax=Halocaridina rubra TaxID=373956 RepID=A0AAN8X3H7_HALRR
MVSERCWNTDREDHTTEPPIPRQQVARMEPECLWMPAWLSQCTRAPVYGDACANTLPEANSGFTEHWARADPLS